MRDRDIVQGNIVHLGVTPDIYPEFDLEPDGTITMRMGYSSSTHMRRHQAGVMLTNLLQCLNDHAATSAPALDRGGREGEFIAPCQGEPLPIGAATTPKWV